MYHNYVGVCFFFFYKKEVKRGEKNKGGGAWEVMEISSLLRHINSLTTNDAYMRHDPCELSISLWEFIWSIKY